MTPCGSGGTTGCLLSSPRGDFALPRDLRHMEEAVVLEDNRAADMVGVAKLDAAAARRLVAAVGVKGRLVALGGAVYGLSGRGGACETRCLWAMLIAAELPARESGYCHEERWDWWERLAAVSPVDVTLVAESDDPGRGCSSDRPGGGC